MNQEHLSKIWPDWTLVRKLGQGSYGGVYEIERILPGGKIERSALKQITIPRSQEEIDSMLAQSIPEERIAVFFREQMQKLVQEYIMMRELDECPNIVACHDFSYQPNGYGWNIYFRMELLRPLKQVIDNRYREMNVIRLGLEVCNALEACGTRNIIHRDIKPDNILVSDDGVFKLGDFGIAKSSEGTHTGTMAGTFGYMAPEVANRQHYGPSADIYSLGMVLYWLMNNNTLPFLPLPPQIPTASQRQHALTLRFSGEPIPEPRNGSADLKKIVLKACAFSPADRYHTVSELRNALHELYNWKQNQTEVILRELGLPTSIIDEEEMPRLNHGQHTVDTSSIPDDFQPYEENHNLRKIIGIITCCGIIIVAAVIGALLLFKKPDVRIAENIATETLPEETVQVIETTEILETETPLPEVETTEVPTAPTFTEATEPIRVINVTCTYEPNETGITITGYSGELPTEAVLPDILDGIPVTKIGKNAFASNTVLRTVWLPESVTDIDEKAFAGCTKLQDMHFSSGLIRIGSLVFVKH